MARKFKSGDRVRVLNQVGKDKYVNRFKKGSVGIITNYSKGDYSYRVVGKNGANCWFMPKELELIKRKKK